MAKLNLKSPLRLMEDFMAGEISKPQDTTAPAIKTDSKTISLDKKSQGEKVRAEIVKDVDTILTNLEQLSKQITEETDSILENTNWGEYDALNENFMEEMLKTFKSMKFLARLQASWPGLYADKLQLELDAVQQLGEFDQNSIEKTEQMLAKVKAKYDKKKKEITANPNLPTEKKKLAREQVNKAWDENEAKIKEKIKKKLDTEKAVLVNKQKQATDTLNAEITEFEGENKIEAPLIQKRWLKVKTSAQYKMDNEHIENKGEIEQSFMDADDPEKIKKHKERDEKIKKQLADETKEKIELRDKELKEAENQAKERMDKLEGDEKEANEKLFNYYQSVNALKNALTSTKVEDYDDDAKLELKKLNKAYNDAKGKVSGTTFVEGKVADDAIDGEKIAEGVEKDVKEALADFRDILKEAGGSKTDTEKAVEAAEAEEKTAKEKFEEEIEGPDGENTPAAKEAKKKYLEAQIKTQTAKKADAESKGEEVEKFDTKITKLQSDIAELEDGGTDESKSVEDVAKETITDGFEDFKGPLTKEESEEKEPETTDDQGNTVPGKNKYTDIQGPFKAKDKDGNDTGDDKYYAKLNDNQSAGTVDGESLNEGLHPKLKKAMKAVNKGETVYGENVRFPGRFKIIEMGELFATVDYEDGTEPMEMASMNIRIDSLQFESAEIEEGNEFGAARAEAIAKGEKTFKVGDEEYPVEDVSKDDKENAKEFVEEAKKELPKKIKLYEGMSIADKFKALI